MRKFPPIALIKTESAIEPLRKYRGEDVHTQGSDLKKAFGRTSSAQTNISKKKSESSSCITYDQTGNN